MNVLTSSPLESSVWKLVWREGRYVWAVLQCQAPEYCGKADGSPLGKAKLLLNQLEECELESRESSKLSDEKVTEGRKWICRRGCFCAAWQLQKCRVEAHSSVGSWRAGVSSLSFIILSPAPVAMSDTRVPTTSCVIWGSCLTLLRFPHL